MVVIHLEFSSTEISEIEQVLLKDGEFNESQRKFLNLFRSSMIMAGPGTGKTTVLSAKIALILKRISQENTGEAVCIITYTNVAVDEIKLVLKKLGIVIEHPHFIGTIHAFFNTFCVEPFFRNKGGINNLVFLDSEDNKRINFTKCQLELKKRRAYLSPGVLNNVLERLFKSRLELDNSGEIVVVNENNWNLLPKYSEDFKYILSNRKSEGILTMDDSFFFAELFLKNEKWAAILKRRFNYLFVDEFQDTSPLGIKCLHNIFQYPSDEISTVVQYIGDPNQSIFVKQKHQYTLEETFSLDTTNRFGKKIMDMLSNVFDVEYMNTLSLNKSYKPVILTYSDEKEILPAYKKMINIISGKNSIFKNDIRQDKMLVRLKKWSRRLTDADYSQSKVTKIQSQSFEATKIVKSLIESKLISKLGLSLVDTRKFMEQFDIRLKINKILIDYLKYDRDTRKTYFVSSINKLLKEFDAGSIRKDNKSVSDLENIFSKYENINNSSFDSSETYTIHSVKGETHRSTLVANIEFDKKDDSQVSFTDILKISYGEMESTAPFSERESKKLLYVGLSRAKYLVVLSFPEKELTEDLRMKMEQDWRIVSTETILRHGES